MRPSECVAVMPHIGPCCWRYLDLNELIKFNVILFNFVYNPNKLAQAVTWTSVIQSSVPEQNTR